MCLNDQCKPNECCQEQWGRNQHANIRKRLFANGTCSAGFAASIWSKPYPDDANDTSAYDVIMPSTACMPDGTGGTTEKPCRQVAGVACKAPADCWSETCDAGKCVALPNGKQCLSGAACVSGICQFGGDMRASCQARPQGTPCTAAAQCSADCRNGRCDGNITPPPSSSASSSSLAIVTIAIVLSTNF